MPKSKRSKIVPLTQTEKKGREGKENLVSQIHELVDKYASIWLFTVDNMRNTFLKEIREDWKGRGRNKVMAKAMGTNEVDEFRPKLGELSRRLTGNIGLLFTDESPESVVDYFDQFERQDYARGGFKASQDFVIPAGPVMLGDDKFPNSMEPQLRALGVPSSLKSGVVTLSADFIVCRSGDKLTHEQARLLMATFKLRPLCYWSNETITEISS